VTIAEQGKTFKENREKPGIEGEVKTRKHPFWPQKIKGEQKNKHEL